MRFILSAAAACLLIGVGLFWYHAVQPSPPPLKMVNLSPDVVQDFFTDQPVEKIASDLDEVSEQMYAIDTEEESIFEEDLAAIEEMEEMDLLTNNDFWKG